MVLEPLWIFATPSTVMTASAAGPGLDKVFSDTLVIDQPGKTVCVDVVSVARVGNREVDHIFRPGRFRCQG